MIIIPVDVKVMGHQIPSMMLWLNKFTPTGKLQPIDEVEAAQMGGDIELWYFFCCDAWPRQFKNCRVIFQTTKEANYFRSVWK